MTETQSTAVFDLSTVIDDAKRVITNPIEFYRTMPTTGGFAHPLIFVAVMAAICGIMVAVLSLVGLGVTSMGGAMAAGFAAVIMFPLDEGEQDVSLQHMLPCIGVKTLDMM